ncbi:MAG: hypothetical protein CL388_04110 [Acidiferrobacteraceae bacterium]|nr:hypothetical protein [Acidiferrobacteraceae bacterium]
MGVGVLVAVPDAVGPLPVQQAFDELMGALVSESESQRRWWPCITGTPSRLYTRARVLSSNMS